MGSEVSCHGVDRGPVERYAKVVCGSRQHLGDARAGNVVQT
jgi:hypothetical protein